MKRYRVLWYDKDHKKHEGVIIGKGKGIKGAIRLVEEFEGFLHGYLIEEEYGKVIHRIKAKTTN